MEKYDSAQDTKKHIEMVNHFLDVAILNLTKRGQVHDESKLQSPEKEMYDEFTPLLKGLTYGTKEYSDCLKQMSVALQHHYQNNTHHPEHFENGIDGMTLLDLIEMFCDWQAAVLRHADGDLKKSIEINRNRFKMSDQMYSVFVNTFKELG